jgi:hypothetical protein
VRLDWKGPQIKARVERATLQAIDDCTEAAAKDAQTSHWWRNRSGDLQGNIIAETAKVMPNGHRRGRFGSSLRKGGFYGLFLERKRPFLRPAADREFPKLARTIRRRLIGGIFGGR